MLLGQNFEIEILMGLHISKSFETENDIFSGWFVCMFACVSVCESAYLKKLQKKLRI